MRTFLQSRPASPATAAAPRRAAADRELAAYLLGRLAALVARQAAATGRDDRVALARAAFSVFLDCQDLGLGAEARAIVARAAPRAAA